MKLIEFTGGFEYPDCLDLAVKFDGKWSHIGSLYQKRDGHRSLVRGNTVFHVGGISSTADEFEISKRLHNEF